MNGDDIDDPGARILHQVRLCEVILVRKKIMKIPVVKDVLKIVGAAGDSARFASKPGFLDNISKRLGHVDDARAAFMKEKFLTAIKNGENPSSAIYKLRRGNIAVPEELRRVIKSRHPFNDYSELMEETNALARKLGFDDEAGFAKCISDLNLKKTLPVEDSRKLGRIFRFIKKHPASLAKTAVAGGGIVYMVSYLKQFQAENTGCFRYAKDDNDKLIRYKFAGNFCLQDDSKNNNLNDSDSVKILSEDQHPLFNITSKWNCEYLAFERGNPLVDEILNAGCNGLCDWTNFNFLTEHVTENKTGLYNPLVMDNDDDDEYMYRCEKATILRALTSVATNVIDETVSGFTQSQLGIKMINFLKSQIGQAITLIMILLFLLYSVRALVDHYKHGETTKNNNV